MRLRTDLRLRSAAVLLALTTALAGGAVAGVGGEGDLVCVEATLSPGVPLPLPPLRARSCALADGR